MKGKKGKFLQLVEDVQKNEALLKDSDEDEKKKSEPEENDTKEDAKPKTQKKNGGGSGSQPAKAKQSFPRRGSITKKSVTQRTPTITLTAATKVARLAQVARKPNEKPKAKQMFPGRSKSWIQAHFMKLGLMPNSILAGELEGEKARRERLEREKKAAEAFQKMQEAANAKAMADRVRKIKGSRQLPVQQRQRSIRPRRESNIDLNDDDFEDEVGHHQPVIAFDEPTDVVDLEEQERLRKAAEEAERLRRLAELEQEKLRAAELEAELRAQRERDEAELKAKRDEEERLRREKAEAEEAERRRLAEEKEAKRKAELEAKMAVKRAKREAMEAILAAKKAAEAEEAERQKKLEMDRRNSAKPSTAYGAVKDFVPNASEHPDKKTVTQDVFSVREKGSLYKAPPPPSIKKSERKPIVPWKRRPNDQQHGLGKLDEDSDSMLSDAENHPEDDDFDPEAITDLWNSNMNGEEVAKTAWNLIGVSKIQEMRTSSIKDSGNEIRQEFRHVMGNHWFPGLDPGMEVNLTNIVKVLFRTMKTGLWREKSEACKAVLYLYQTFSDDFQDPLKSLVVPQLELFHDPDWQFRATLCAVLPVYKQMHPDLTYHLIYCLQDKSDVVRKTAKKSLTDMGINTRESLRQTMVALQMIPDLADKKNGSTFLEEELARIRKEQAEYDALNASRIHYWQGQVPPKKMPGSLNNRPDSYEATLVKRGLFTKEDFEKFYTRYNTPQPTLVVPQTADENQDQEFGLRRSRKSTNRPTIPIRSAIPKRRLSYDRYLPETPVERIPASRPGSQRPSVYGRRNSSRASSVKNESFEKISFSLDDDLFENPPGTPSLRQSITKRVQLGSRRVSINNPITFNHGAIQKKQADAFFDKPDSEEEIAKLNQSFQKYQIVRQGASQNPIFNGAKRASVSATPGIQKTGFGGWSTLRSSIVASAGEKTVDPWGFFAKNVPPRRESVTADRINRNKYGSGVIVSTHARDDEEVTEVDDKGIKIYSRRVSMQPVQVSYYKRVIQKQRLGEEGSETSAEENPTGTIPAMVTNEDGLPPIAPIAQSKAKTSNSLDHVPVITIRMKTPQDPNGNYTTTATPPRNTTTAATTLFDANGNSRPWTVDDSETRLQTPLAALKEGSGGGIKQGLKSWSDKASVLSSKSEGE
ncbi:hypothetical protein BDR26DRAFT_103345 [Obelidium mucronatum]|nr:hypothetical protein BDR26DRAFT_103345 [Obelidium mucronatum]